LIPHSELSFRCKLDMITERSNPSIRGYDAANDSGNSALRQMKPDTITMQIFQYHKRRRSFG
jgi:hypothetical protein